MAGFGNAAQINRILVLITHDQADQIDVKRPALRQVFHVQHGMAGPRNIEGRIVIRLRQRHGLLQVGWNECAKLDTSRRSIPLFTIRRKGWQA
jgi:hypothetical protein